ncbi:MAG: glycosyltransferase [Betaproteobacteria bacterium HGW-Betaproteobacteria-18]|jgi:glycosyltransferase involved in cell wall biosynthesis|nr:MAG: glycosyltransferase [Betaproteobacteria bacterium HGW-Betaproteobacteria-6]PKO60733.1 MAG: glycosyltransferase [Betaproteobacteria bacterium HGW-Betaproteobacteria-18]
MKILLVNHLLDPVSGGGTAERTFQLARFLAEEGVDCTVLALDIGIGPERRIKLGQARLITVPCVNDRFFIPQISFAKLSELVANADIVHLSGHWTLFNALIFRACRQLGKPYLFCPAGALKPFGRSLWLKRLYDFLVGRKLTRSATACIAITEAERADFLACGVPDERVVVIPNGIDPDAYRLDDPLTAIAEFRQSVGVGNARFILFLGRLNLIKGPDLLLDAFCQLDQSFADVHLVMAGPDGGMLRELKEAVSARGLAGRVHFPGYVGGLQKVVALHAATLLAIPSRREAMSIVVLEGGVCACPVLFTDACGLDDLAREGAGTMVQVSAVALAESLTTMLRNPERSRASACHLNAIIRRHFFWGVQAQRYLSLSQQVVGRV